MVWMQGKNFQEIILNVTNPSAKVIVGPEPYHLLAEELLSYKGLFQNDLY